MRNQLFLLVTLSLITAVQNPGISPVFVS